ncbi:MAG: hypothetical protein HY819_14665 [Acidobacteria bacterium]|nr:hypothetical protein [Acidobacteriota bacterium]
MMEITIKPYQNITEDFYIFEKEVNKIGLQIINKAKLNLTVCSNKVELIINVITGIQAKTVHKLAYKYFGKAYVFLSLAA